MKICAISIAALVCIAALYAADSPILKEGLWSIHTETTSQPGNRKMVGNRSVCRTQAFDAEIEARLKARQKACKVLQDSRTGSEYTSETECVMAGSTVHLKSNSKLSGDTAMHSEEKVTYTPALTGMAESETVTDQKYVGACPAGMQPGDMMTADGQIRHRSHQ